MSKVVVVLKDGVNKDAFLVTLIEAGFVVTALSDLPIIFVEGTTAEEFPFRDAPEVQSVEDDQPKGFRPSVAVTINQEPDGGPWPILRHTSRDRPWGDRVDLPWTGEFNCVRDGTGVDVYLVDSGIVPTHEQFGGRATRLDSFVPTYYHGTSCASCAVGSTLGLARGSEVFMAAGLRNANGSGSLTDILTAVNACLSHYNGRAALNRPAVMSLSFAGGAASSYNAAVSNCVDAGIVVLAAAANDRLQITATDAFPGEVEGVILVGGTNMDDLPYNQGTHGTNFGLDIDILGGSQRVKVADIASDTAYRVGSGTSFGTPHTAGVVACMLQGYARLPNRLHVQHVGNYLYNQATFGRYRKDPRFEPMTPAIAYLDPGPGPYPLIPALVKRAPS